MRRVVVTGLGVVTPAGDSVDALFRAQAAGRNCVGPITAFDATGFPTTFAAQVPNFDLGRYVADPSPWKDAAPNSRFAAAATKMALEDAGLLGLAKVDPTRCGVFLGTGEGWQDFPALVTLATRATPTGARHMDGGVFIKEGLAIYQPGREYEQELHTSPAHLAEAFGLEGPNWNCLTACAAGSQGLGEALDMIRVGEADIMVSGGSHSMIQPLSVTGFSLLTALSRRSDDPAHASRPFDLNRDGFVLGEGAGVLILEELEHARRRGANIYAELTGYGVTADAFRVTDNHPEGRGAITCIKQALAEASLNPDDIGYVNAHGTSTKLNDHVETVALKAAFGELAYRIPVSSSKSMIGHLIAAAGAVEAVISIEAIRRGVLPPTINYETPDPDCDLDYIPNTAREKRVRHVLSNSFGFGGQNASLVVSRFEG